MYNYNNNGWANQYGYGYAKPKLPNPTNPLTKEQMAMLKQNAPEFTLAIDNVTALKAICTHRDESGETLIQNTDGSVTCSICGTTFTPVNTDEETVKQLVKSVKDIMETTKIMYVDMPDEVTKGIFQMTPFFDKLPQLYKIAIDHYGRYSNSPVISGVYNNGTNTVNLYAAMMNPAMGMGMGMPMQQMPYGMPMQQPMQSQPMNPGAPMPDTNMNMGTPAPNGNPFDIGNPAVTTDNKQYSL
jgi:hypothetical protein